MMRILESAPSTICSPLVLDVNKEPIASYITTITQALRNEQETIREYQAILEIPNLPYDIQTAIQEIMDDEKDHMVILSNLIASQTDSEFPSYGDDVETKAVTNESLISRQITFDGTSNTTTYSVVADVLYDKDLLSDILINLKKLIRKTNHANKHIQYELISLESSRLILQVTSDDSEADILSYVRRFIEDIPELELK